MSFLQPWMLVGLLAAFVPVVLHLMNRQRANRIRFPMMTIVTLSQQRRAPALKLKRWLLLAARMAILLLIPLAMAQPYTLCGERTTAARDRTPAAVVLVVDVSASMGRAHGTRMDAQALAHARSVVRELRPWDQVRVLSAGEENRWLNERWSNDHGAALRALDGLRWEQGSSDLPSALMEARSGLLDAQLPAKRTYVISDNDASAWQSEHLSPPMLAGMGELVVWAPDVDAEASELYVADLVWEDAPAGGQDLVEIQATVHARGVGLATGTLSLNVDDMLVGTLPVELEGGESETFRFLHNISGEGVHHVLVRVDGPGVASVQERWLPVHLSRAVRALLVNGASSSVARMDELYYLTRALDVDVGERQHVQRTVITPERLSEHDLSAFDVVLLANVEAVDEASVQKLRGFVEQGGGLWITPGSLVRPEQYNRMFGDLLPRAFRTVTKLSSPDDLDANIRATRFSNIDHASPLFRIFSMGGGESLQSARVFSYLLLEPDTHSSARVLASYGDGGPAVLEKTMGAGRVLLWTTTLDMDWTDLPIRTAFLPLVHRSVRHLAQRGGRSGDGSEIGASFSFDVSGLGVDQVVVVQPNGRRLVLDVVDDFAGFTPTVVGVYAVSFQRAGVETRAEEYDFSVHAPVDEAIYEAIHPDVPEAWSVAALEGFRPEGVADIEENRRRTWPALLLVALFLLYFESLLGVRRRVWEGFRRRPRAAVAE